MADYQNSLWYRLLSLPDSTIFSNTYSASYAFTGVEDASQYPQVHKYIQTGDISSTYLTANINGSNKTIIYKNMLEGCLLNNDEVPLNTDTQPYQQTGENLYNKWGRLYNMEMYLGSYYNSYSGNGVKSDWITSNYNKIPTTGGYTPVQNIESLNINGDYLYSIPVAVSLPNNNSGYTLRVAKKIDNSRLTSKLNYTAFGHFPLLMLYNTDNNNTDLSSYFLFYCIIIKLTITWVKPNTSTRKRYGYYYYNYNQNISVNNNNYPSVVSISSAGAVSAGTSEEYKILYGNFSLNPNYTQNYCKTKINVIEISNLLSFFQKKIYYSQSNINYTYNSNDIFIYKVGVLWRFLFLWNIGSNSNISYINDFILSRVFNNTNDYTNSLNSNYYITENNNNSGSSIDTSNHTNETIIISTNNDIGVTAFNNGYIGPEISLGSCEWPPSSNTYYNLILQLQYTIRNSESVTFSTMGLKYW